MGILDNAKYAKLGKMYEQEMLMKKLAPKIEKETIRKYAPIIERDAVSRVAPLIQRDTVQRVAPIIERDAELRVIDTIAEENAARDVFGAEGLSAFGLKQ